MNMRSLKMNKIIGIILLASLLGCKRNDPSYPLVNIPTADTEFYRSGLEVVERQARNNPENPDAQFKKAIYHQAVGNTDAALAAIRQAISLDPNPQYLMTEAQLYAGKEQYTDAINSLSRAQLMGGDYPEIWHLQAQMHYRIGEHRAALAQIENAIKKFPQGTNYQLTRGRIKWTLHDTVGAEKALMIASEDPTTQYEALKLLVEINRADQNYEKAFEYLQQNRRNHKGDPALVFELGQLMRESGNPDSALVIFNHLKNKDTSDYRLYQQLGLCHFQRRNYDSTLYYTQKTLELSENHLPALLVQARVYDRRRYYSAAVQTYQAILALDSTYVPAVEEFQKLQGKIAYLQRIEATRQRNAEVKTLEPKSTKESN